MGAAGDVGEEFSADRLTLTFEFGIQLERDVQIV